MCHFPQYLQLITGWALTSQVCAGPGLRSAAAEPQNKYTKHSLAAQTLWEERETHWQNKNGKKKKKNDVVEFTDNLSCETPPTASPGLGVE